jgi:N-acetylglucosamine-6-phosphate deacetylase
MILLSGADIVLPDRLLGPGTVVIDGTRIVDVVHGARSGGAADTCRDLSGRFLVPGFVDVHVHGVDGHDVLDGTGAVAAVAARLPRFGTTAFCPTSIACRPEALRGLLAAIRAARASPSPGSARVLPAHLESNFISPEFRGAQPLECLRLPGGAAPEGEFTGDEILREITAARPDVGILTIAPELEGALDLIRDLVAHGHKVSLGHSGASYEQSVAGIEAGATQATHLFNRMTPALHRAPGLVGAVLESDDVAVEIVCDGVHVHPAMMRVAVAAKQPARVMAITDGTAGSGLPSGTRTVIGGRPITTGNAAYLDDGTLAGSILTMDRAFAKLVTVVGLSVVDAAIVCSTTPSREMGLQGLGVIAPGATADLAVLDRDLRVVETYISGDRVWPSGVRS